MAERDFYEILGVQRDASQEQIRRAYRDLARRYHPDVNKAPDAQARFTEIQEAYDVLSDENKRRLYDRAGRAGVAGAGAGPWSGQGGARWSSGSGPGGSPDLDLDDLGSMFEAFFGGSGRSPHAASSASRARAASSRAAPEPVRSDANIPFMTMARGGTHTLTVVIDGARQSLDVAIPRAIDDGTKLRVRAARGRDRDIILTVRVGEHPVFRRPAGKGLDLEFDLPIRIDEAALGTKVDVPTLEGSVGLTVPPGTPGGRKLRLRGRGLSDPGGRTGDLHALVRIVPPHADTLTERQAATLREIGQAQPDPRSAEHWRPGWSP